MVHKQTCGRLCIDSDILVGLMRPPRCTDQFVKPNVEIKFVSVVDAPLEWGDLLVALDPPFFLFLFSATLFFLYFPRLFIPPGHINDVTQS